MPPADKNSDDRAPVDWAVAHRLTGGDDGLLQELVEMFPTESAKQLDEVREAIERADAELLRRSAHSLKSTAGLFGAQALVDTAFEMETAGREANLEQARGLIEELENETARVAAALVRQA
jgi:two-component system sensor histidine kinase/response regulator